MPKPGRRGGSFKERKAEECCVGDRGACSLKGAGRYPCSKTISHRPATPNLPLFFCSCVFFRMAPNVCMLLASAPSLSRAPSPAPNAQRWQRSNPKSDPLFEEDESNDLFHVLKVKMAGVPRGRDQYVRPTIAAGFATFFAVGCYALAWPADW